MAALAAFFVLINREKDRQSGREEVNSSAKTQIINRMENAENIRSSHVLDDELLLQPRERNIRGVQGLQTDLHEQAGSLTNPEIGSGKKDKSPQQDLGAKLFIKPKRWVTKVFIHCSASDRAADDNIEIITKWHLARGFKTIGYHFYISKDGVVHQGRDIEQIPAAQEGNNTGSIAICLGGLNKFSEAQFEALRGLYEEIKKQIPDVTFHGHCEVNPHKTCPNFDYKKVLSRF